MVTKISPYSGKGAVLFIFREKVARSTHLLILLITGIIFFTVIFFRTLTSFANSGILYSKPIFPLAYFFYFQR